MWARTRVVEGVVHADGDQEHLDYAEEVLDAEADLADGRFELTEEIYSLNKAKNFLALDSGEIIVFSL